MRVSIATRIYAPEPSAASFRLRVLAKTLAYRGHAVHVRTVKSPANVPRMNDEGQDYRVSRFPVLRDSTGYVRGYVQYLSFDVPLFFRVLFGRKADALVVEPPPTTWFAALVASKIRRIPLYCYAADVWSDASESTGAPGFVVSAVRWLERTAWHGSKGVLAVNEGVADRVRSIAPQANVTVVGNGIDTELFSPRPVPSAPAVSTVAGPYVLYSGTASEWQGAEVFVEAAAKLKSSGVALTLVFLGQGTALPKLKQLAEELEAPVVFVDPVPPEEAAQWLRGAIAGLASIQPGAGYDFAFPTKLYAAWATGTPVVYAGPGPAQDTLLNEPQLGFGVEHDAAQVAEALRKLVHASADRNAIAHWAEANVSLASVAGRVTTLIEQNGEAGAVRG